MIGVNVAVRSRDNINTGLPERFVPVYKGVRVVELFGLDARDEAPTEVLKKTFSPRL